MPIDTKRILVVDPQMAGVSGDMMVAALLDLGANHTKVIEAMKTPRHILRGCNGSPSVFTIPIQWGKKLKSTMMKR